MVLLLGCVPLKRRNKAREIERYAESRGFKDILFSPPSLPPSRFWQESRLQDSDNTSCTFARAYYSAYSIRRTWSCNHDIGESGHRSTLRPSKAITVVYPTILCAYTAPRAKFCEIETLLFRSRRDAICHYRSL